MTGNSNNQNIIDGLACQKIGSWDQSNWNFLAKGAPYLDETGLEIDGYYEVMVIDFDKSLIELDTISTTDTEFYRINEVMEENSEFGYVPSYVNSLEISPKFKYFDNISGNIYYKPQDEPKLAEKRTQDILNSIFGFNPIEELEKINSEECANL